MSTDPHAATLRFLGNFCKVHKYHWPKPLRTVKHHIKPQEYGGKTTSDNVVDVCDTGHYAIHTILDALLAGHTPPKGTRQEMAIARQGYLAILADRQ